MGKYLDLDDVVHGHKLAEQELNRLREDYLKAVEQAFAFASHLERYEPAMWRSKRIRWENTLRELQEDFCGS